MKTLKQVERESRLIINGAKLYIIISIVIGVFIIFGIPYPENFDVYYGVFMPIIAILSASLLIGSFVWSGQLKRLIKKEG